MKPRVSSRFLEGLLYALTAFGPFAFGCVEPWSRAALEFLVFVLALACFLRGRPAVSPAASAFWLFPAAFAAAGLVQLQTLAAPDGPRPWGPFTTAPHATEAAVLLWAACAAVVWSVPRVIVTHGAARRYARFLFGLGVVLAALGLLQAATGADKLYWLRDAPGTRIFGPYYNRDHAANLLLMCMAVGAGLFISKTRSWPAVDGPPPGYLGAQGRLAGGVLFIFLAIVVCGSRGALLAMPLAGAFLAFFGAGFAKRALDRRTRAAAALAAAAVVVFLAFRYVVDSADAGALVDKSVMGRLFIYGDSWRWWRDAPLFGTGFGSFETVYPAYQDFELRAVVSQAHSDWLQILLEAGAAGLLAALAATAFAAFAAVRAWRAARSREMRALAGGALAAAAAFSVHSLFEFSFQIPGNAVVFMGLVGFLLSVPSWADKAAERARPQPPSAWASVLAAVFFVLAAQAAVRPAAAAWLASASGSASDQADGLARAYAIDPDPSFLKRLASICSENAVKDGRTNLDALRVALRYSLAAAQLRPFDSDVLSLAGGEPLGPRAPGRRPPVVRRSRPDPLSRVEFRPRRRVRREGGRAPAETLRSLGLLPRTAAKP